MCDCRIFEVIYGWGHAGWIIVVVAFRFWIAIRIRLVGRISLWCREISRMFPMKFLWVWVVFVGMWRIWTSCTLWFLNWGKVISVWIFCCCLVLSVKDSNVNITKLHSDKHFLWWTGCVLCGVIFGSFLYLCLQDWLGKEKIVFLLPLIR